MRAHALLCHPDHLRTPTIEEDLANGRPNLDCHHSFCKSSTSMIKHFTSSLKAWYKCRRILRFSSYFIFWPHCISFNIRTQLRKICQIRVLEQSRSSSFSIRGSFKNVSRSTHNIQCIMRQSRIAAALGSGTRNSRGLLGTWVAPELLAEDRKKCSSI